MYHQRMKVLAIVVLAASAYHSLFFSIFLGGGEPLNIKLVTRSRLLFYPSQRLAQSIPKSSFQDVKSFAGLHVSELWSLYLGPTTYSAL